MHSEALWAAIGTLGGLILREMFRARRAEQNESGQIRKELREEVARLSADIKALMNEVDCWKQKFYDLTAENLLLKERCKNLEYEISNLKNKKKCLNCDPFTSK